MQVYQLSSLIFPGVVSETLQIYVCGAWLWPFPSSNTPAKPRLIPFKTDWQYLTLNIPLSMPSLSFVCIMSLEISWNVAALLARHFYCHAVITILVLIQPHSILRTCSLLRKGVWQHVSPERDGTSAIKDLLTWVVGWIRENLLQYLVINSSQKVI